MVNFCGAIGKPCWQALREGKAESRRNGRKRVVEMGTANFKSMDKFPLIVAEDEYIKVCPECGCGQSGVDKCECCGAILTDVAETYDYDTMSDIVSEMERFAERLNSSLMFHKVTVESGYYSGVQFYVTEEHDVADMDNGDTQYYFGMCRSVALRKYATEVNRICRELRQYAKDYGMMELAVSARFSNGETWYSKVA